jgi:ABC-type Na+ efflux pump permease subunit
VFGPLPRLPFSPSLDGNPVLWREWHRRRPSRWMGAVWVTYAVGAVLSSGLATFADLWKGRTGGDPIVFVNGLLVAVGLLFLSITAVTSLSDERTQGSLDVLLTTPLTTAQIVRGKWWGAFRPVPFLAILPTVSAVLVAITNDHYPWSLFAALLLFPLTLAYGAFVTSLGLGLATWVARFGRAVSCSVVSYVLLAVAFPFLCLFLAFSSDVLPLALASASPWFGPMLLTASVVEPSPDVRYAPLWCGAWAVVFAGAALVLLHVIHRTFERCLGRVPASARPAPPARPVRPALPEPVR